jgi:hypothetical protein
MYNLIPLKELFTPVYGVNLELVNITECEKEDLGSMRYISRTEFNNGLSAYVKRIDDVAPNPAHTISIAVSGSVLSAFYQDTEYYSGRDLYYLLPKRKMSKEEMIFYALCIEANKYKYNYGRAANKTLKNILVPAAMPNSFRKVTISKISLPSEKQLLRQQYNLDIKHWKKFKIEELFTIQKGERLVEYERIAGEVPLITATSENNGVSSFISYDDFYTSKKIFENKITIDMFCNVFFHNYKYFSDDNIHTLIPKYSNDNPYVSLFLVSVLRLLKYKFNFGRQLRLAKIKKESIKLPTKNGEPDFEFMADYIKTVPYSCSILSK